MITKREVSEVLLWHDADETLCLIYGFQLIDSRLTKELYRLFQWFSFRPEYSVKIIVCILFDKLNELFENNERLLWIGIVSIVCEKSKLKIVELRIDNRSLNELPIFFNFESDPSRVLLIIHFAKSKLKNIHDVFCVIIIHGLIINRNFNKLRDCNEIIICFIVKRVCD
jgi:hypothetical protein